MNSKINNQNKVAYIVPVYNVNKYLDECLNSLSQIKTPKQVIIVDDRGSEDPLPIISKYLSDTSFLYFKNEKNLGQGFARNEGMKQISDDVTHVYFVDSDDYVLPDKIDEEFQKLSIDRTRMITTHFSLTKREKILDNAQKITKSRLTFCVWGSFWKADICKMNKFTSRSFEDAPWVINYFKLQGSNFKKIEYLDQPTYVYRRRKSSTGNSKIDLVKINDALICYKQIYDSGLFTFTYADKEKVYFKYLSVSKKERKNISMPEFNLTKFQKMWIVFAFFMQRFPLFKVFESKISSNFFE